MNNNRPLAEISATAYPSYYEPIFVAMKSDTKVLNSKAIRCEVLFKPNAFDRVIQFTTQRIHSLAAQHYGNNRPLLAQSVPAAYEFAIKSALSLQLVETRKGIASTGLLQAGTHAPINGSKISSTLGNLINQIGDYSQPTGLTALAPEMNADILEIVGESARLACVIFGPEKILKGTEMRQDNLLQAAEALIAPFGQPQANQQPIIPTLFAGDIKGRDAARHHIGKAYERIVNDLPPLGVDVRHAFPRPDEFPRLVSEVEEHYITHHQNPGNWPMRQGRAVPPFGVIIDDIIIFIVTQQGMNNLGQHHPVGGHQGEYLNRLRMYILILGFPFDTDAQAYRDALEVEQVRIVEDMTTKQLYQAISAGVKIYNEEYSGDVEAVSKSDSYIFTASDGGTAAMLIREHSGYEEDEHLSVYKVPFGITKTQQMYGFMLNQTSDITYNKVKVKVNTQTELMRSNLADAYFERSRPNKTSFNV